MDLGGAPWVHPSRQILKEVSSGNFQAPFTAQLLGSNSAYLVTYNTKRPPQARGMKGKVRGLHAMPVKTQNTIRRIK